VMFANDNKVMATAEAEARAARRGLWQEPNPIPPWEFRKQKRGVSKPTELPQKSFSPESVQDHLR